MDRAKKLVEFRFFSFGNGEGRFRFQLSSKSHELVANETGKFSCVFSNPNSSVVIDMSEFMFFNVIACCANKKLT